MNRRKKTLIVALIGATAVMAACMAPDRLRVTRHKIHWPRPGRARIVHLTDLHVGWATADHLLEQAVEDTVRLAPDLVVLTGDYVNRTPKRLGELKSLVSKLPKPCVAVLGNHDHWAGADQVHKALEEAGAVVLRDQHVNLALQDMQLTVVGIDHLTDEPAELEKVFSGLPDKRNVLVLVHSAKAANRIARAGGRLILAGHTHGGHVDLNEVTDPIMRMLGHNYIAGWYSVGPALLYVNSGIGSAFFRGRVGHRAAPEVALIEISGDS